MKIPLSFALWGALLFSIEAQAQTAQAPSPVWENPTALRAALQSLRPLPNAVFLGALDLSLMRSAQRPRANEEYSGKPLTSDDTVFPRGVGVYADSEFLVALGGGATRFISLVDKDDSARGGSSGVIFSVEVDGVERFNSGEIGRDSPAQLVSVDLTGAQQMRLKVTRADNLGYHHADWLGAQIVLAGENSPRPAALPLVAPFEAPRPLPPPTNLPPQIFTPRVVGASPGKPVALPISATGRGALEYRAFGLPAGLSLNAKTGLISGSVAKAGIYEFRVGVRAQNGDVAQMISLLVGEKPLQTPFRGWNAWNVFGDTVTAEKIKEQADFLVSSGLAARGYNVVFVDDSWQDRRDPGQPLQPNARFGDIEGLASYLHARGLKFGIYSSATKDTCAGYNGSAGFEAQDARQWAQWGVDFVKYDWCDLSVSPENLDAKTLAEGYARMGEALKTVPRDIVYTLTPYGLGEPAKWAASTGASSWWVAAQSHDRWENLVANAEALRNNAQKGGPGGFNDGGWLSMGKMGATAPRFSQLSIAQQQSQFSLWCLAASPLVISADTRQLDPNALVPFVSSILMHEEMLAIQGDALGAPARRVTSNPDPRRDAELWIRPLLDGTWAVGLWNRRATPQTLGFKMGELGLSGAQPVRNVWERRNLGQMAEFSGMVAPYSTLVFRVGTPYSPSNSFASFKNPAFVAPIAGESGDLRLLWSRDGQNWLPTPGNLSRLKARVGARQLRDIALLRDKNGLYHLFWTAGANERGLGYANSPNLTDWSEQKLVRLDKGILARGAGALGKPALSHDATKDETTLFFRAKRGNSEGLYAVTTADFATFSDPRAAQPTEIPIVKTPPAPDGSSTGTSVGAIQTLSEAQLQAIWRDFTEEARRK